MFASLKNKIREETGSDVSTVVRKAGNVRNVGTRHASQVNNSFNSALFCVTTVIFFQTGSTSSISGSALSLDGFRDENASSPSEAHTPGVQVQMKRENSFEYKLSDGMQLSVKDVKRIESRDDEWRKRLLKRESELMKKIEKKDEEWKVRLQEREKEWKKTMEKHDKEKSRLEDEVRRAEDAKRNSEQALRNAQGRDNV